MGAIQDATSDGDFDAAMREADLLVADFYTPSCVLCRKIEPMLGAMAASLEGRVSVVKVNAEANPELAARYNIRGVPSLVLLRDEKEVERASGFMTASMLKKWVSPFLN